MVTMQREASIDDAVETLKFLSDRNRLRIVIALTRAETCVCDLIDELELSQPLVSYHLGKLRKAGLVRARRDAQWTYYSLDDDAWRALTHSLSPFFNAAELAPAAAFGAGRRCDQTVPDLDSRPGNDGA
ncbi:MAG: ArsR/SmtB family transcription factor [Thermomicrobiales bacterium]